MAQLQQETDSSDQPEQKLRGVSDVHENLHNTDGSTVSGSRHTSKQTQNSVLVTVFFPIYYSNSSKAAWFQQLEFNGDTKAASR